MSPSDIMRYIRSAVSIDSLTSRRLMSMSEDVVSVLPEHEAIKKAETKAKLADANGIEDRRNFMDGRKWWGEI